MREQLGLVQPFADVVRDVLTHLYKQKWARERFGESACVRAFGSQRTNWSIVTRERYNQSLGGNAAFGPLRVRPPAGSNVVILRIRVDGCEAYRRPPN